ncbi:alkaline phosphatase [Deinococcus metalli]|uniref:Alkaline phosphatase n=1 Tax=Deinococcus metalli TaxID=1141878 RepID=A0A7W8KE10_9DEIO|nr:alkaline phosphatase [Deinococcus metalli]MBB5376465.1 alkaline phosphatase [Deinococcus metalli]GHF43834.1 alkaline phosphatase [Deinococcus metalli]
MRHALLTAALVLSTAATAAQLQVYPYDGARLLAGQHFDLRIEAEDVKDFKTATVTLDGRTVDGLTRTTTKPTSVEWTLRTQSLTAGSHILTVRYSDGAGDQIKSVRWNAVAPAAAKAKNVILFIGDGMGWNTVNAANLIAHPYNPANGMPTGKLAMMSDLSSMASVNTSSYDSALADSANTASSIATGQKIQVNALNVYPDNTADTLDNPRVETISAMLRRAMGKGVGIVSSAFGVDATPAAFASYTRRRGDYSAIADQYFKGDVQPDVLLIGGSRDFIPSTAPGSRRKDATDWIEGSQKMGYTFVSNRTELNAANATKLFGLFNIDNVPSYLDRAQYKSKEMLGDFTDMPYLWDSAQKAVQTLEKNPNGFFLMVEAGMVDKYEHPLDWQRAVWDVLELDRAVAWAKEYAKTHPDTLVLVTADHAHSLSVYGGYDATKGPGKREAVGVYEAAGFPTYGDKRDANGFPLPETDRTYAVGFAAVPDYCETYLGRRIFLDPTVSNGQTGTAAGYVPNPKICAEGSVQRTGNLPPTSNQGVHTADPLPLFAFGAGAENFSGMMDQTDIFFGVAKALGLDATKSK